MSVTKHRSNYPYEPGGYREVFAIAFPLILSTASLTMMLFVDRMFLAWYSLNAVAAAVPGGITYFTICSLFIGVAQYTNSIVAQNHGANKKQACSRAVAQGIWFSLISVPLILMCIPLGRLVLIWGGHGPDIVPLEIEYFTILMIGGTLLPFNAALSSFFSGRGRTSIVMWGNVAGNAANILLDYLLIFGKWGFPELGIRGAAIATATTNLIPAIYWLSLYLAPKYQFKYKTRKSFHWDKGMFLVLLKFGIPSGIQFFLDVAAFTVFVLLIGRLGEVNLAASNIVLSIELLAFLPMVGVSIATATLVGEYIGRGQMDIAEKSVHTALKSAFMYTGVLAILFFAIPEQFIKVFTAGQGDQANFTEVVRTAINLLKIIAIYTIFDALYIIYSGALKGAGDTKFAMWAQVIVAWVLFVIPVYLIVVKFQLGLYPAWVAVLCYVILLGVVFWLRFRSGAWRRISLVANDASPTAS